MRSLLLLFFLLLPNLSEAAVVHVQQCGDASEFGFGSSNSDTCSFPGGTAAGDTLVVACQWGDTNLTVTATDSNGDHFTEAPNAHYMDSTNEGVTVLYYPNVPAGVTSVTCNLSASVTFVAMTAHEYSGLINGNVFDTAATSHGTLGGGSNNGIDGPMTSSTNGELIYAVFIDDTSLTGFTATGGTNSLPYTLRENISAAGDMADEDAVQTSRGPVTSSMTDNLSGDTYVMSMVAFRSSIGTLAKFGTARINNGKFGY